ncbi:uncharacterized protein RCC_12069 [Ramularia collo-cygni]|uniref:BTB domain-containing protein n=1 Tax=Ramularia collo-cygni TaxID=112498 RepID=A0A2D3URR9_9PEZI|nr:uncharacterized protein RCC_12069 [Ramularia collo-cygni]CZT15190.1 uncharacterized protein RCC_12069 [Ramularia collo-cygni]
MRENYASTWSVAMSDNHQRVFDTVAGQFGCQECSDLVLKCDGSVWNIHKAVVCSQSAFFRKACTGRFKEGQESVITLPEDNSCVVHEMIRYFYTAEYNDSHHFAPGDACAENDAIRKCCFTPTLFQCPHAHHRGQVRHPTIGVPRKS